MCSSDLQVGMVAADRQRKVLEVEVWPARQRIDQKLAGCVHGGDILPRDRGFV